MCTQQRCPHLFHRKFIKFTDHFFQSLKIGQITLRAWYENTIQRLSDEDDSITYFISLFQVSRPCQTLTHHPLINVQANKRSHHSSISERTLLSNGNYCEFIAKRDKKGKPVCLCPPLRSAIVPQQSYDLFRRLHGVLSILQHPMRSHPFQH